MGNTGGSRHRPALFQLGPERQLRRRDCRRTLSLGRRVLFTAFTAELGLPAYPDVPGLGRLPGFRIGVPLGFLDRVDGMQGGRGGFL